MCRLRGYWANTSNGGLCYKVQERLARRLLTTPEPGDEIAHCRRTGKGQDIELLVAQEAQDLASLFIIMSNSKGGVRRHFIHFGTSLLQFSDQDFACLGCT